MNTSRFTDVNPLLLTDYYSFKHERMKENVDWEISHFYNRNRPMILFGFSWTVADLLGKLVVTEGKIRQCEDIFGKRFNSDLWRRVIKQCNGFLPLKVEALPDGTWVPAGTAFAQISNTVEGFGELVSWFEGALMHAYFPSSCATEAFLMRKYLQEKGLSAWRIHSFGWRAQRSIEDAAWASLAWHLSLPGSDDVIAYNWLPPKFQAGSIPASAHKVVQQFNVELQAYYHQIDAMVEDGENTFSMVIDTFSADGFIEKHLLPVAAYAVSRGVKVVFRPDSGDTLDQTRRIWSKLYANYNDVAMNNHFAVIIGDGMDFAKIKVFDQQLERWGIPLKFVNYGMGSGYFSRFHRDELGWAMKTAYSNGKDRMKFARGKTSIPGAVNLVEKDGEMWMETKGETQASLYRICYWFSPSVSSIISEPNYAEIFRRVQDNLEKPKLQQEIIMSDRLKQKIEMKKAEMKAINSIQV